MLEKILKGVLEYFFMILGIFGGAIKSGIKILGDIFKEMKRLK